MLKLFLFTVAALSFTDPSTYAALTYLQHNLNFSPLELPLCLLELELLILHYTLLSLISVTFMLKMRIYKKRGASRDSYFSFFLG